MHGFHIVFPQPDYHIFMRHLLLLFITVQVSIIDQASANTRRTRRPAQQGLGQSACLPSGPEAEGWEICGIYLHGQNPTGNGSETQNRAKMLEIAQSRKCKVAVPMAPNRSNWDGVMDLRGIERVAVAACGGAPLAAKRFIAGFSGGGYRARQAAKDCRNNQAYSLFLTLGAPHVVTRSYPTSRGYYPNGCNRSQRVVNNNNHIAFTQFPADLFERNLTLAGFSQDGTGRIPNNVANLGEEPTADNRASWAPWQYRQRFAELIDNPARRPANEGR